MVFPVVMYGCECWTMKKTECQRINDFELWCWRRLLRVPWTARRSNKSNLKRSVLNIHLKAWCWSWYSDTLAINVKNWLIWKGPYARKDWRWEERIATLVSFLIISIFFSLICFKWWTLLFFFGKYRLFFFVALLPV